MVLIRSSNAVTRPRDNCSENVLVWSSGPDFTRNVPRTLVMSLPAFVAWAARPETVVNTGPNPRPACVVEQPVAATEIAAHANAAVHVRPMAPSRSVPSRFDTSGRAPDYAPVVDSSSRLRVRLTSTGMPGPIVVANVTFFR